MMDFVEFVKCIRPFLPKGASNSNEKAVQAIIDNFTDENPDLGSATLKNYATKGISKRAAKKLWSKRNEDKFRNYIKSIPEKQRELLASEIDEFVDEEVNEKNVSYICERLLSEAVQLSAKEDHESSNSDDYVFDSSLIVEVGGRCPICGKSLIKKLRTGKKRKNYKIVKIFPDNLDVEDLNDFEQIKKAPVNTDADENLIVLCSECAEDYEFDPDIKAFEKLVYDKNTILQEDNINQEIRGINLNQQLGDLLIKVAGLNGEDVSDLSYSALKIENKIINNFILQNEIQRNVSLYYPYIEEMFSNMDNASELDYQYLAEQVAYCYRKLKKSGMSQNKIFNRISEWFIEKVNLSEDYKLAGQVLTSFFVQNCEVFENENAK